MINIQERKALPPRILFYAPPKFGKTTFGSMAPNPIFIQTEDGLDNLDVDAFPLSKTFGEVLDNLTQLCTEEHDYKTLVVDSVDWLEPLIWKQLCAEHKADSIEMVAGGYGKGYSMAIDLWKQYIDALNYLRSERDMMIVQIAHAEVKRYDSPTSESYDRYKIKVHKNAAEKLMEHSDVIIFGNFEIITKKTDVGFNKTKVRAIGDADRLLFTEERPAFVAGNRFSLPPEIPFSKDGSYWAVIAEHIPYFNKLKGE